MKKGLLFGFVLTILSGLNAVKANQIVNCNDKSTNITYLGNSELDCIDKHNKTIETHKLTGNCQYVSPEFSNKSFCMIGFPSEEKCTIQCNQ